MRDNEPRVWIVERKGKRGTTYNLRYYSAGRYRSKSAGGNRKKAERQAAKIEAALADGTYTELRKVTWAEFVDEHCRMMDARLKPGTVKRVRLTLTDFGERCGVQRPRDVGFRTVEAFEAALRAKGLATATVSFHLRYLRAAFNAGVRRGYLVKSPMVGWQWSKVDEKAPRVLSADEKAKLLKACPSEQWKALVTVCLVTGCRISELLGLTWSRIDLDGLSLTVTHTKGKRDRVQPISTDAAALLRGVQAATLKHGGPFKGMGCYFTIAKAFRGIVTAAGIDRCTLHDLRRTFCTDLLRVGVNQLVVQKLAGHVSAATTAKYYQHVDDGTKRAAVDKLAGMAG